MLDYKDIDASFLTSCYNTSDRDEHRKSCKRVNRKRGQRMRLLKLMERKPMELKYEHLIKDNTTKACS